MTRDNALYTLIGLLVGFVLAYIALETIGSRQPPRLPAGAAVSGARAPGGASPAEAPPGGNGGNMPSMEEIQALSEHVKQNPEDADAVLKLANLNFDIKSWGRSRDLYLQYLKLRPNSADVISDLGICYRELKEYQTALDYFHRAQKLDPENWQSLYNEVVVWAFDLKDFSAAEKVLDRLKSLQPDNPDVGRLAAEVDRQKAAA